MARRWPNKDPDEVLDYKIDFTDLLASEPAEPGDTIDGDPEWEIAPADSPGLTQAAGHPPTHDDTSATIWLEGGVSGQQYEIRCRIETAGGRTMEVTYRLLVQTSRAP